MNPPLLIVSAIAITLVWWLITAGFLLLGSRIAGIRDRSFGRSLGIAVLSGIASFLLGAGLGHLPVIAPAGGFIAFLFGILAAAFFLKVRMAVSYEFFSARGLPAARSSRPEDFTADHNAWRVVLGLEDAPEGTPFLFTRNFNPETLETGDHPIELEDVPPFGKDGMVVVLKGGAAYYLKGEQLNNASFNPAQTPSGPGIEIIGP